MFVTERYQVSEGFEDMSSIKLRSLKTESRQGDSMGGNRKPPVTKNASKSDLKVALKPKSRKKQAQAVAALRAVPPAAADVPTYLSEPLTEPPRLSVGTAGDHHSVHQFMVAVFRGPTRDSFLSTLDDPFYEPCDRLLIKSGEIILSHAHLTKRLMCFNGANLPVGGLNWVGTLPEFRGRGHASSLVRLAERRMVEDGAVAGLLRTQVGPSVGDIAIRGLARAKYSHNCPIRPPRSTLTRSGSAFAPGGK